MATNTKAIIIPLHAQDLCKNIIANKLKYFHQMIIRLSIKNYIQNNTKHVRSLLRGWKYHCQLSTRTIEIPQCACIFVKLILQMKFAKEHTRIGVFGAFHVSFCWLSIFSYFRINWTEDRSFRKILVYRFCKMYQGREQRNLLQRDARHHKSELTSCTDLHSFSFFCT